MGQMVGGLFEAGGAIAQGAAQYVQMEAADNASQIALGDSKLQVKQIELAATQREADRKEALNRALASQNAMAGASGIQSTGSVLDIQNADIEAEAQAAQRDRFMTDLEKRSLAYNAVLQRKFDKMAKKTGQFSAFNSMLSTMAHASGSAASGSTPTSGLS